MTMVMRCYIQILILFIGGICNCEGFPTAFVGPRGITNPSISQHYQLQSIEYRGKVERLRSKASSTAGDDTNERKAYDDNVVLVGVVAPLKYMGPYPCLSLHFPNITESGTSLDFVLDTGANMNTIHIGLVDQLHLPLMLRSKDLPLLGSAGVGGEFHPGDIYQLGACQLDGLPPGQNFIFMTNLTAAALPRSTPVGDGLLGLHFFASFEAGVEFDWYGTDGDPPTMIFYYGKDLPTFPTEVQKGLIRVPLEPVNPAIPVISLFVEVNGVKMKALLDTGSPITVLNHRAAKEAGIETVLPQNTDYPHEQAIGDDSLTIRGVDGGIMNLDRSMSPVPIWAGEVSLGDGTVYVGDLPGLGLVGGLGNSSVPAVVLGLDSLRRTYRMVLRVSDNEVWFEELQSQPKYCG